MDLYERGRFDAAASAYRAALAALASHLADDLHCRAALHAAVAGWRLPRTASAHSWR